MVYQYLRKCSLIVAGESGDGLELDGMHIRFQVSHAVTPTPSTLNARIYNLAPNTIKKIQNEYVSVNLKAGYSNPTGEIFGSIFVGGVVQFRDGRENPTDTFLDIVAGDGVYGFGNAVNRKTLAAGYTNQDVKKVIDAAFAEHGITSGYEAPMPQTPMPRGRVMFGMTRDYARDLAKSNGQTWSIKSGQYETVPLAGVLPDDIIELTSHTGLIGLPQQTMDGVVARCLLNPNIWHNRVVWINNKSIQRAAFPTPLSPDAFHTFGFLEDLAISRDGRYKVIAVDHIGDTRGQAWYTEMWLIGVDATEPPANQTFLHMNIGSEGPPRKPGT